MVRVPRFSWIKMIKNARKKLLSASLLTFTLLLFSCDDDTTGPDVTSFWGVWNSGSYSYHSNLDCSGEGQTFDEYRINIIQQAQNEEAHILALAMCNIDYPDNDYCTSEPSDDSICEGDYDFDTNADCLYYESSLSTTQIQWEQEDSTKEEDLLSYYDTGTLGTDTGPITLSITSTSTFDMSYAGVCLNYENYSEPACTAIGGAEWNEELEICEVTTQVACEDIADGIWDDGYGGTWSENGEFYIFQSVDENLDVNHDLITFDGESVNMIVYSSSHAGQDANEELCVGLNFSN